MGEIRADNDEAPRQAADALAEHAERYADLGFAGMADTLRAAGRYPESLAGAPLILDTDIGGDPDDAVAVAVAALNVPELALVLTCDEHNGQRARFARHLLDLCGRQDVPVVAGIDLGNTRYLVTQKLTPDEVPPQTDDMGTVLQMCEQAPGVVRWVGMGPMSNLGALLTQQPELAKKLDITLMGGAINYRDPERAEHNVRLDVPAARTVLATAHRPRLVISDVTFTREIEITHSSDLYWRLAGSRSPAWANLLATHMHAWFERFYPGTMQHDPLTLAVALQLPFVDLGLERVALDERGRMTNQKGGHVVFLSYGADYPAFNTWLTKQLLGRMRW